MNSPSNSLTIKSGAIKIDPDCLCLTVNMAVPAHTVYLQLKKLWHMPQYKDLEFPLCESAWLNGYMVGGGDWAIYFVYGAEFETC